MPTKEDFITQIKGDLKTQSGESSDVLNERLARVEAAGDDDAAKAAYFGHLEELRQQAEEEQTSQVEENTVEPDNEQPTE